ncbi:MAG: ABC transporter permease [Thermoplasmatota archaeon]
MSAYGTWMLIRREIARYLNVWGQTIVPPVVTAALFLFIFGNALGDRIGDFDGVPYLTFLVPGLIIQGAVTNAYANNGTSVFDARRAGYIEDVLTSPLTDGQIVFAYTVSGTTRGLMVGILTLAVAWPVASGWQVNWPLFLLVMALSSAIFALLGMFAGLLASRWDHVFVPQTFLLTPLTFLGGVFYPVSELPGHLAAASKWNPILYMVDAQRASLLGVNELSVPASVAGLVIATGLSWLLVWRLFATSPRLRG